MAWTVRDFKNVKTQVEEPTSPTLNMIWYKPVPDPLPDELYQYNGTTWAPYAGTLEALDAEYENAIQASLRASQLDLETHLTPGTLAHAASDISFDPTETNPATDVQSAIGSAGSVIPDGTTAGYVLTWTGTDFEWQPVTPISTAPIQLPFAWTADGPQEFLVANNITINSYIRRGQGTLVFEKTGANILTDSDAFDASTWTKSNLSVTANQITSPETGLTTADLLVAATSNANIVQIKTPGGDLIGKTYQFSVWVRPVGTHIVAVTIAGNDLTDRVDVVPVIPDGTWQLLTVRKTFSVAGRTQVRGYIFPGGGSAYSGTTVNAYVAGARLQQITTPTFPTTPQAFVSGEELRIIATGVGIDGLKVTLSGTG